MEMMDIKEIIDGLQKTVMYMRNELEHAESTYGLEPLVEIRDAALQALALLTPKLLTADEVMDCAMDGRPVWVEEAPEEGMMQQPGDWAVLRVNALLGGGYTFTAIDHLGFKWETEHYGTEWRAWSNEATDEQREAAEWL